MSTIVEPLLNIGFKPKYKAKNWVLLTRSAARRNRQNFPKIKAMRRKTSFAVKSIANEPPKHKKRNRCADVPYAIFGYEGCGLVRLTLFCLPVDIKADKRLQTSASSTTIQIQTSDRASKYQTPKECKFFLQINSRL